MQTWTTNSQFMRRLLGLLPLVFFGARLMQLASEGEVAHILWMCHVSNLLLALGLLLGQREWVRVSVLWLLLGVPLWPIEIVRTGVIAWTSIGTHYMGLAVGLLLLPQMGMGKRSWLYAWIWFLGLQQATRLFTPAALNINLAHAVYPGWEKLFPAYWQYWLFTAAGSLLALWLAAQALGTKWFVRGKKDE